MSHRAGLRSCIINLAARFHHSGEPILCILHDHRNETYIACTLDERDFIQKHRGPNPLRQVFLGTARELSLFCASDQIDLFPKEAPNDNPNHLPRREQLSNNDPQPHHDETPPA